MGGTDMEMPMTPNELINMLRSYKDTRESEPAKPLTQTEFDAVVSMFCSLNDGKSLMKKS